MTTSGALSVVIPKTNPYQNGRKRLDMFVPFLLLLYKILLRDELPKFTLDQRDAIIATIRKRTQEEFTRMHMKDYEYLVKSFQPSQRAMIWLFVIGCVLSIGLAVFAVMNDFDEDD